MRKQPTDERPTSTDRPRPGRRRWSRRYGIVPVVVALLTIGISGFTATGQSVSTLSVGGTYVAMGDSYSSGEGIPPFLPGSITNGCHRSDKAYAYALRGSPGFSANLSFVACSNAVIGDAYNSQHKDQPRQLNALNPGVTAVTMTMGGNDIHFREIMAFCVASFACNNNVDLELATRALIWWSGPRLERLYRDVLAGARNAQVYVLGYPHLFSPHPAFFCSGIEASEARWITSKEDALNNEISQAIKRIRDPRLHYIDTSNAFRDGELCAKNHTQYVTGLVVDTHNWVYSFHPTAAGQQQLANAVKSAVLSGRL
jgi:lysophospholipase L1-like esterase